MKSTVPKSAVKRQQPKGGSRKGCPNKTTKALKEMILGAMDQAGGPGGGQAFLLAQAKKKNNAPFMALVGKVLPMQVTGEDGGPIQLRTIQSMSEEELKALVARVAEAGK